MGAVVDIASARKKREDQEIRLLIDEQFKRHEDYGLILNLLAEYGAETMTGVIRSQYDPTFAR